MPLAQESFRQSDLPGLLTARLEKVLESTVPEVTITLSNEAAVANEAREDEDNGTLAERDISAGAEEDAPGPSYPVSSKAWNHHVRRMKRLNVAIEEALSANSLETTKGLTSEDGSVEPRSISLSFNGGYKYVIPWAACHTWPCMEKLLNSWFKDDADTLSDIAAGRFLLLEGYAESVYSPHTWDTVIKPNSYVSFTLKVRSGPVTTAPPTPVDLEPADILKTDYENRIQYKVSYYRREAYTDGKEFDQELTYNEPVEFEVAQDHERLPALEEMKDVLMPRHSSVRRRGDKNGVAKLRQYDRIEGTSLKIHSPYLLNVLKSLIHCSAEPPAGVNEGLDVGLFSYPYRDLYYYLEELSSYATATTGLRLRHSTEFNQKFDEHFDLLRKYLEAQPGIQIKEARARWSKETPTTTFATFWLLMKPGTDVYVKERDGSLNAYVLDKATGGVTEEDGLRTTKPYTVSVWRLAKNSRAIWQWPRNIAVPVFDEEREITDLPVFPVRFNDNTDNNKVRDDLIQRGKKYFEFSKTPTFLQFTGQGLRKGLKTYKRARVVVEHMSSPYDDPDFLNDPTIAHHIPRDSGEIVIGDTVRLARCECDECKKATDPVHEKFSGYEPIDPNETEELTDHQYMIMASHIFGFILKDRIYDLLDVAGLKLPSMAETAIDKLVMNEKNKDIIKAVAKVYTENSESGRFSADFIYGKGEGQVILLHGPPGTGKTLTAESVAEFARKPLLSITAADLGHEPEALEKSLLRYFKRANDWEAVVLLDEADVYLEQRSPMDLRRNSIVSVFLRALDYFQGILFLTTNRVGQFDEAFMSRIHLSLGYDKLSDESRTTIWENLFQKLSDGHDNNGDDAIRYDYQAEEYVTNSEEVRALDWNGREIRNAFQTAVALAVYDAKQRKKGPPKVLKSHLKQVVSMSLAFRKYIKKTHEDMDHSQIALLNKNRADGFPSTPSKLGV